MILKGFSSERSFLFSPRNYCRCYVKGDFLFKKYLWCLERGGWLFSVRPLPGLFPPGFCCGVFSIGILHKILTLLTA
nr:MAG TPA: hypothetical protein [Caudoviricetes sp.]